jgi:hypothetical protein
VNGVEALARGCREAKAATSGPQHAVLGCTEGGPRAARKPGFVRGEFSRPLSNTRRHVAARSHRVHLFPHRSLMEQDLLSDSRSTMPASAFC